jgi:hypothetical protein
MPKRISQLTQVAVAAGDDVPIVKSGNTRRAKAGQASGFAILDAAGMVLDSNNRKIVRRVSNSNGVSVRFSDNLQICYFITPGSANTETWTFPEAFSENPIVIPAINSLMQDFLIRVGNITTTQCQVRKRYFSGGSFTDAITEQAMLLAIGKWY